MIRNMILAVGLFTMTGASAFAATKAPTKTVSVHSTTMKAHTVAQADEGSEPAKTDGDKKAAKPHKKGGKGKKAEKPSEMKAAAPGAAASETAPAKK